MNELPNHELVLGGTRSGKSRYAEALALTSGRTAVYIATSLPFDDEMRRRVSIHKARRDSRWTNREEPVRLADALGDFDDERYFVLVDCLGNWLCNCLYPSDQEWAEERRKFLTLLPGLRCSVVLVSSEASLGVVPLGRETRQFLDEIGQLHQDIALAVPRVSLIMAGLRVALKDESS